MIEAPSIFSNIYIKMLLKAECGHSNPLTENFCSSHHAVSEEYCYPALHCFGGLNDYGIEVYIKKSWASSQLTGQNFASTQAYCRKHTVTP
jgi:hypothetical protein